MKALCVMCYQLAYQHRLQKIKLTGSKTYSILFRYPKLVIIIVMNCPINAARCGQINIHYAQLFVMLIFWGIDAFCQVMSKSLSSSKCSFIRRSMGVFQHRRKGILVRQKWVNVRFAMIEKKLICSFITNFLELLLDNLFVQFPIRNFCVPSLKKYYQLVFIII